MGGRFDWKEDVEKLHGESLVDYCYIRVACWGLVLLGEIGVFDFVLSFARLMS
jgi:hypothetical protein